VSGSNHHQVEFPLTLKAEQHYAADRSSQDVQQREGSVSISPQEAFQEFVEDHSELLRRLAL